ncbi:tetratricopeptide repeat protein [Actinoplanes sp. G11-F43]|uniref:tetratricopeptide repeat protein n=1 Tax=Actinoplanes sp. G11-F43 TaxID=3424130 RepID=UPI003D358CAB
MTVLVCKGDGCARLISVSRVPGGNPTARADPEGWATDFTMCPACEAAYCDRCRGKAAACPVCGTALVGWAEYERLPRDRPHPAVEAHRRGRSLYESDRPAAALAAFDEAVALRPGYPEAHLFRGFLLEQLGRPEEAAAAYARVLTVEPEHADALFRLGTLQLGGGQLEQAVRTLDRVIALRGFRVPARLNRIVAQIRLGRPGDALAAAEALIAEADVAAREMAAAGFDEPRISELMNAEHPTPGDQVKASLLKAAALLDLGRAGDALELLDFLQQRGVDTPELHSNRAAALRTLGRPDEAVIADRIARSMRREQ